MTVRETSKLTINVIMEFWKKASIPTRAEQHCIQKLESVFYEWKGLQKHKSRSGEAHKKQEHEFVSHLEDLFDIAHQDALTIISNPEDRAFQLRQREKGRPGSIGVRNKVTERKARAAGERKQAEARRRQKSVDKMNISACLTTLESSSGEDSDHDQEQIAMCDDEYKPVASSSTDPADCITKPVPKKAKTDVLTTELMAALDRTQTSSRNAVYVLCETASSLGHNVDSLNISRNSIHRARCKARTIAASHLKSEFLSVNHLTVHWDGKLLEDLTTREHVDRLPILISGVGCEQLLAVPKLSSGTGESQATAVVNEIKQWGIEKQSELKGITAVAAFGVLVYLRVWITAPLAINAPLNDFLLMRQLLEYPDVNISSVTSKKLGLHLWYISEELVALALFDSRVPAETKKLMLAAMENAAPEHPPKRPRVETSAFTNSKGLEQFCTANSMTMFRLLQLQTSFMSKDPSEWDEDETYQCALRTVKGLAVVNDRAERGVALIQDYNKKLTKDEEQLQFMLHVVSEHRQLFPDCSKSGLMMAMSSTPTTP
ncbi:DNA repair protein RAD51 3 [Biomphalaria pfeifferi]|uniref:DNA repair protein RAD51 3 n=1 Tax=Biomphalaria pfeifferi TaxID=112525 RepID=A0AAD8BC64_BIOPF|nr:DNA repair protein RAD51 3 [Biomphalaria pfeifferi]